MGLKELRLKHSFSQEKVSDLSKLSVRTIQRIEKENKASLESIRLLSIVFKMEPIFLKEIIENTTDKIEENKDSNKHKNFFDFLLKNKAVKRFIFINILLIVLNLLTGDYYWFIYPLLGWGIPLFYKSFIKYKMTI